MRTASKKPYYVLLDNSEDRMRPTLYGFWSEKDALTYLIELLGLEDEDVEDLEAWHEGDGWYSNHGVTASFGKLEFPVE